MKGINGSVECPKECPTHLITPEIGGNIYTDYMSSLTLDWMV
jgi:hypothetical protein